MEYSFPEVLHKYLTCDSFLLCVFVFHGTWHIDIAKQVRLCLKLNQPLLYCGDALGVKGQQEI